MVELGPLWMVSQFTSAHSERGYVGWVERSETHHSRHWQPVIDGFPSYIAALTVCTSELTSYPKGSKLNHHRTTAAAIGEENASRAPAFSHVE